MLYHLVHRYSYYVYDEREIDVDVITVMTNENEAIRKLKEIYQNDNGKYTGYCHELCIFFSEIGEEIDFERTYKKTLGWIRDGEFIQNIVYKNVA